MFKKRFVITSGDARVGKSTVSRLLLELYLKSKCNARVFYHGYRNKLSMYKTKGFEINHLGLSRGDSDRLLLDLEMFPNIDVVLTDMPGQNHQEFKFFDKDVSLIENLNHLGYRVTFLHPISHRKDCVEDYLQDLYQNFGSQVDYVVIKNYYFGKQFRYYEGSRFQADIKKLNGLELVLGGLHNEFYELLEDTGLPYAQLIESNSPLNTIQRSIVFNWMENFHNSIVTNEIATNYLGLGNHCTELASVGTNQQHPSNFDVNEDIESEEW
ncbi:hypothetical protein NIES21_57990 (plasmid) [Anabaenopsis circularis NIES-21]|uniref:CobQ/CobB/MinD/ParA nucleotide binding domain-containing protein n=1 Tax=Anabaenopsis circularis NIES-21 TaxID=1085406 RepID=A0A1Z4GR16_9CYAN|nr:hypothetical protein NIES21_57990 [Anabaenopsis circularis NIES-21]